MALTADVREDRQTRLEEEGQLSLVRQRDIFTFPQHAHCVLVGCGGIGSPTAMELSKKGLPKLTAIDFDEVEPHNIPNQFYKLSHNGMKKVEALKEECEEYSGVEVEAVDAKIEDVGHLLRDVVITGLDSMEARKNVWELVKLNPKVELLIDGRIAREHIVIHTVNPCELEDIEYFEKECLYSDKDAIELSCTERGIMDVSYMVAALIGRNVRGHYHPDDSPFRLFAHHQNTMKLLSIK